MTEPEDYAMYASKARRQSYIDNAEKYLQEAKQFESLSSPEFQEKRKQTLLLGSIAASLIALSKK